MGFDQSIQVRKKIDAPMVIDGHKGLDRTLPTCLIDNSKIKVVEFLLIVNENSPYSKSSSPT
jgi:hypothetical protein